MGAAADSVEALDGPSQAALRRAGVVEPHAPPPERPFGFWLSEAALRHTGALEEVNMANLSEEAWLTCQEPGPMLDRFRNKGRAPPLRRFACACLRRVEHLLTGETERRGLEVA